MTTGELWDQREGMEVGAFLKKLLDVEFGYDPSGDSWAGAGMVWCLEQFASDALEADVMTAAEFQAGVDRIVNGED